MTAIHLKSVAKSFGRTVAVDRVAFTIDDGDLFFLLGPSGCGKTTLLRMLAGFVEPTGGTIHFGDRNVTHLAPNQRNAGMVFQSYALWPHKTVAENVAYGLEVRKVSREERVSRVEAALRSVRMEAYGRRKPNQLSGGQQQRVALARALVVEPDVLLLDEPLSNLDAKLRLEMRDEIKRICRETKITTVYVTHDQKEALSMADRIAVMRDGRIEQIGPPREVYGRPSSRFVSDFLGESNFLPGEVESVTDGLVRLRTAAGVLSAVRGSGEVESGSSVTCSIRPESLRLHVGVGGSSGSNVLRGRHEDTTFLGEMAQHRIRVGDSMELKAFEMAPRSLPESGSELEFRVEPSDVVILPD